MAKLGGGGIVPSAAAAETATVSCIIEQVDVVAMFDVILCPACSGTIIFGELRMVNNQKSQPRISRTT